MYSYLAFEPMQTDFTMHQFRLFLKVADNGSFSKTAISLGLPQPSISRLIARIEVIAGTSRFEQLAAAKIVKPEISRGFLMITPVNRPFPAVCREAAYQIRLIMQELASEARWIWES